MKKIISGVLALCMLLTLIAPTCFAGEIDNSGGTGAVPVTLTAEAAAFNVTVPTVLPVTVTADGTVATASGATIQNHSHGAVKVTGLTVEGVNGWVTSDYDSFDAGVKKIGAKDIALKIGSEKTTGKNTITFAASSWQRMTGEDADTNMDELTFTYDAKVSPQAAAVNGTTVARVVFTIGWDYAE